MGAQVRLASLLAWLSLVWLAAPTRGEVTPVEAWPSLRLSASLRTRGEFHNFFDPGGTGNNDYAFGATVLRGAIAWKSDSFDVLVEGQNSALFGLPDNAVLRSEE